MVRSLITSLAPPATIWSKVDLSELAVIAASRASGSGYSCAYG